MTAPTRSPEEVTSDANPLRIWCLVRGQEHYIAPVERVLGDRAEFVYDTDWCVESLVSAEPDVVVCVNDWPSDVARCIDAARELGIPSLVLQDGILEWRCQYENPRFGAGGGGPQHQPVLADRIACIGAQSSRAIEGWGNAGRTVVTGMPRMDWLLGRVAPPVRVPGRRVLIMTAKNPGFNAEQRAETLRSLRALKRHCEPRSDIEVAWRISRVVEEELGVSSRFTRIGGEELAEMIEAADAVVTTPSTAMLEAMLLGRPVAALDFHNVPRFVPTAWTISAPEHIGPVLSELLDPPASKMLFQKQCLVDCLRCDGPSAPRVAQLLEQMAGRDEVGGFTPPARQGSPMHDGALDLARLYPGQEVFTESDVQALQVRVARLQHDNAALRASQYEGRLSRRLWRRGGRLVRSLGLSPKEPS